MSCTTSRDMDQALKGLLEVVGKVGRGGGQGRWSNDDHDIEAGRMFREGSDAVAKLSLESITINRSFRGPPANNEAEAMVHKCVCLSADREKLAVCAATESPNCPKGRFLMKALRPRQH